jgi:hypothetical protein
LRILLHHMPELRATMRHSSRLGRCANMRSMSPAGHSGIGEGVAGHCLRWAHPQGEAEGWPRRAGPRPRAATLGGKI